MHRRNPVLDLVRFLAVLSAACLVFSTPARADDGGAHCPFKPGDGGPNVFVPTEELAYTPCVGGFAGIYPCSNIDLQSNLTLASMGCTAGNSLWGWTDPLDGKEYALMGCNNGIAFVDISVPTTPVYLGKLPTHTSNSTWRDVRTYNNHAFIISEASGHGMQVFDLTRLRDVETPPVNFTEDAYYGSFGHCHTININEATGFAYAVGSNACFGGPHIVNIQNPESPVFAGCVGQDGYTHETQCVIYRGLDPLRVGHEVCFNCNEDTLTVVDVTNKGAPAQLSRTTYTGVGYTHQGWLTEDHRYYIIDDELDERNTGNHLKTYIWDVKDLAAPLLIGVYTSALSSIDHNQYVVGNYLYQANYRAGLRILDLTNIATAALSEVAYFDIYPNDNLANFNAAWNIYPYFPSGNIIISGIEQGLYVVKPTGVSDFGMVTSDALLPVCSSGSTGTMANLYAHNGYTGSATLSALGVPAGASLTFGTNPVAVPGASSVTVATSGLGGGSYPMTIKATDGANLHTSNVTLVVTAPIAAAPALSAPADGATNQPITMLLQWAAVANAQNYEVQVSLSPTFTPLVYTATVNTLSASTTGLASNTQHYWRVRALNACGGGAFAAARSFITRQTPPILIVDDADDTPDVLGAYTTALGALGASWDLWQTFNDFRFAPTHANEPDAGTLANYRAVVWFSGDVYDSPDHPVAGPSPSGETALASFLDDGNCLLLSAQDYIFDRGNLVTPFMSSYLGLGSFTEDAAASSISGVGPTFGGLGPYTLTAPVGYGPAADVVNPDGTALAALSGGTGTVAISKSAAGKSIFFGFGLEMLNTPNRVEVLGKSLNFCGAGPGEPTLSVAKVGPNLEIGWSAPAGACATESYAVYRGSLTTLHAGGVYSHDTALACGMTIAPYTTPLSNPAIGTAAYFLVVAGGGSAEGSYGRSSGPVERPRSGAACKPTQDLGSCF